MIHVLAVVGLAAACVAWLLVQRASQRCGGSGAMGGSCGACTPGTCRREVREPAGDA